MANNILAIRNDRFGEFLLNIPAFRALKQANPGSRLTLMVNPYAADLAKHIEGVDEVVRWENRKHSFKDVLKLSSELKKKRFDLCVIFNPTKESNIISYLAGIPLRLGYSRKWGFLLNRRLADKKALAEKHEVEYNLDLVRLIGADIQDKALSLSINDDIIINSLKALGLSGNQGLVAIHPWTSDPVKQWQPEQFRKLAQELIADPALKLVVIGGKEEIGRSQALFAGLENKLIDLTGKTDLLQLAAVLKKCKLLISGDSGPVHLACCVNTPVLAIFRNDLPGKTAKRWGPWGRNCAVIEKPGLDNTSVEEVYNKAKEMLK